MLMNTSTNVKDVILIVHVLTLLQRAAKKRSVNMTKQINLVIVIL